MARAAGVLGGEVAVTQGRGRCGQAAPLGAELCRPKGAQVKCFSRCLCVCPPSASLPHWVSSSCCRAPGAVRGDGQLLNYRVCRGLRIPRPAEVAFWMVSWSVPVPSALFRRLISPADRALNQLGFLCVPRPVSGATNAPAIPPSPNTRFSFVFGIFSHVRFSR